MDTPTPETDHIPFTEEQRQLLYKHAAVIRKCMSNMCSVLNITHPDPDDTIGSDSDSDELEGIDDLDFESFANETLGNSDKVKVAMQSVKDSVLEKSRHYGDLDEEIEVDLEDEEDDDPTPYFARPHVNFMNLVCDRMNDNNRQRRKLSDKGSALIDEWFLVQEADVTPEAKAAFYAKLEESYKAPGYMYADNQPVRFWGGVDETSYDWLTKDILEPIVRDVLETYLSDPAAFPRGIHPDDLEYGDCTLLEGILDDDDCNPYEIISNHLTDMITKLPLHKLKLVNKHELGHIETEVKNQVCERHNLLIENKLLEDAQIKARMDRRILKCKNESDE